MDNNILELMTATTNLLTARVLQEVKAGKDPKNVNQETKIRIGQALNAAFALDATQHKSKNTVKILEDSIYYENLILIRQAATMEELREFLDKAKGIENGTKNSEDTTVSNRRAKVSSK